MSIKIAITNEKGGCGKTTSAVNISAILAERGYRVLLADVDPQSYATMYYGLYNADDPSLYDAITGVWPVNDAIVKTVFGVDVCAKRRPCSNTFRGNYIQCDLLNIFGGNAALARCPHW